MQKLVAVTGVTGFVGGHLLSALLAADYRVRVLVRDVAKVDFVSDQVEIVAGDLNNAAALEKLISGADAVVHCAGAIMAVDRGGFFDVNRTGAENVAKVTKASGVGRFILVSSLAAREPQLSDYAASKRAGEDIVAGIIAKDRLVIVRPPAVYGPGDRATLPLIKALTGRRAVLPGLADQKISWIFVEDLVALLVCVTGSNKVPTDIIEVDDGREGGYRFGDLVDLAGQAQGRHISLTLLPRPVVVLAAVLTSWFSRLSGKAFILSPAKVRELYHPEWVAKGVEIEGWQPQVQFKKGFCLTLDWYQQNGWLPGGGQGVKSQDKSEHGESVK